MNVQQLLDMEKKLLELQEEYKRGQRHLDLLDQQRQQTRDTLLRIHGAIQVLEELLQHKENGVLPNENETEAGRSRFEAASL